MAATAFVISQDWVKTLYNLVACSVDSWLCTYIDNPVGKPSIYLSSLSKYQTFFWQVQFQTWWCRNWHKMPSFCRSLVSSVTRFWPILFRSKICRRALHKTVTKYAVFRCLKTIHEAASRRSTPSVKQPFFLNKFNTSKIAPFSPHYFYIKFFGRPNCIKRTTKAAEIYLRAWNSHHFELVCTPRVSRVKYVNELYQLQSGHCGFWNSKIVLMQYWFPADTLTPRSHANCCHEKFARAVEEFVWRV